MNSRNARSVGTRPADQRPLDYKQWEVRPARSGTVDPLVVTFREALDHGLLLRALGVAAPDGSPMAGDVSVGKGELSWSFMPKTPWQAGKPFIRTVALTRHPTCRLHPLQQRRQRVAVQHQGRAQLADCLILRVMQGGDHQILRIGQTQRLQQGGIGGLHGMGSRIQREAKHILGR